MFLKVVCTTPAKLIHNENGTHYHNGEVTLHDSYTTAVLFQSVYILQLVLVLMFI